MPLSWNEIKSRAMAFSREWETESSEDAEAKTFWDQFFQIFGISRRRIASFEQFVQKAGKHSGYIDLFWPGVLIAEHKSRGKDLDRAFTQAIDYFPGISDKELPRYVIVSDFARFRIHDLETGDKNEFPLAALHDHVEVFSFIAGYQTRVFREQDPVNLEAAGKLARLHDHMLESGYDGHDLEVYLVRVLFCMFAEDTGIFLPRGAFYEFIQQRTSEDGSDLGSRMAELFEVLNRPMEKRLKTRDEQILAFTYINGRLFEERLPVAAFDAKMRQLLLDCCDLDWGKVSPAVFGSLFQGIMDREVRRNLGAHYTSEKNILKVIAPLFLDDLRADFEKIRSTRGTQRASKLKAFHTKLAELNFFDPACGCGNFLVISYRELRRLELEVIHELYLRERHQQLALDVVASYVKINVDQFHGIEIEEWPAQIARVAMWLMDHQMNIEVSKEFGQVYARVPLVKSANIVHGNALTLDWNEVVPADKCNFIFGNPPFVGGKFMSPAQRQGAGLVFEGIKNAGLLDFVAAWYVKATRKIRGTDTRCAFVSTNSITQGEQAGVLWSWVLEQGMQIFFAHRTFSWTSEARGKAAVHCVIVGFAAGDIAPKWLFSYDDLKGEAHRTQAGNINPYLVDGPDSVLANRKKPLCPVPAIGIGNKPIDGGNYLFTAEEKAEFLAKEPQAAPCFRRWLGADEFLNGYHRYCLWLGECSPATLKKMPEAMNRIQAVRQYRLASKSAPTRKLADKPTRFHVENMPNGNYLVIPEVSSERRFYIPVGFEGPETFCSNLVKIARDAEPYHLAVISSLMHNAWMRAVAGRLKSDYRYSAGIVYNNFPWPDPTDKQKLAIEATARAILDARTNFPDSSLSDLYDPLTMPQALRKAHTANDRAVDAAYGRKKFTTEAERVGFLFERYSELIAAEKSRE